MGGMAVAVQRELVGVGVGGMAGSAHRLLVVVLFAGMFWVALMLGVFVCAKLVCSKLVIGGELFAAGLLGTGVGCCSKCFL